MRRATTNPLDALPERALEEARNHLSELHASWERFPAGMIHQAGARVAADYTADARGVRIRVFTAETIEAKAAWRAYWRPLDYKLKDKALMAAAPPEAQWEFEEATIEATWPQIGAWLSRGAQTNLLDMFDAPQQMSLGCVLTTTAAV